MSQLQKYHKEKEIKKIRYIKQVKLKKLSKDKNWISNLINRDRVLQINDEWYLEDIEFKDKFEHNILSMMDGLEEIFPDMWDIDIKYYPESDKFGLMPVIYFPEINITNSEEKSHLIQGLIVGLAISNEGKLIDILGTRSHFTYNEFIKGYHHSHLNTFQMTNGYNSFNLNSFCLGTSEILDVKTLLASEDFNIDVFKLFLLTLDSFVRWESLEGGPYIYMRKINSVFQYSEDMVYTEGRHLEHYHDYYELLIKKGLFKKIDNINVLLKNGKYVVAKDKEIISIIKDIISKCSSSFPEFFIGLESLGKWQYSSITSLSRLDFDIERIKIKGELPYIIFNGEIITLQIEEPNLDEKIALKQVEILPGFLNYVVKQLENKVYENEIRANSIKRIGELENA